MRLRLDPVLFLVGLLIAACARPAPAGSGMTVTNHATPEPSAVPLRTPNAPAVWIGGEGCVTVLREGAWHTWPFPGIVRDIAIDGQGRALLAPGLRLCDGDLLRDLLPAAPGGEQDAVAVDAQGRIWVGYYGGVAVLAEGRWQEMPLAAGCGRAVRDLACGADGVVWVGTDAGLARYDGQGWRCYGAQSGLVGEMVDRVLVDGQGRVWAGHDKGLSVLGPQGWTHYPLDAIGFVRGLVADAQGHVLAGSLYHGISLFDGQEWRPYSSAESGLPGDRITALANDAAGRLWVGTRYGLAVQDGDHWIIYREANSGLGDERVSALALSAIALTMPPPTSTPRLGRLVGQVRRGRGPAAGARVVLCSELSLSQGFGDNPCEATPNRRETRTGADGAYSFDDLPAGHYAVAAEVAPGQWMMRTRVLDAVRYAVREGETTVAEPIEATE